MWIFSHGRSYSLKTIYDTFNWFMHLSNKSTNGSHKLTSESKDISRPLFLTKSRTNRC